MFSAPAVAGGSVFVGSCNGLVHAIDAGTGRARWTYNVLQDGGKRAEFHGTPVSTDDLVIFGSDDRTAGGVGYVYAFEQATGTIRWKYRAGAGVMTDIVREGDSLYAVTLQDELISLDVASGRLRWTFSSGWINERLTNVMATLGPSTSESTDSYSAQRPSTPNSRSGEFLLGPRRSSATPFCFSYTTSQRRVPSSLSTSLSRAFAGAERRPAAGVLRSRWYGETARWPAARRGNFRAFSPNGSEQWSDVVGRAIRGVGVTDRVLYVGTQGGTVYAYRPPAAGVQK